MPTKSKKKASRRKGSRGQGVPGPLIHTVGVRTLFTGSLSGGAATVAVNPNNFPPVTTVSEGFEFYRVTKLRYRLHRNGTITTFQGAAYIAGVVDTAPSTIPIITAISTSVLLNLIAIQPTEWRVVNPKLLKSYMNWYKTIVGTPDPAEEIQGNIFLVGSGAEGYALEVEAEFQFRSMVAIGVTPQERAAAEIRKERERLLKILGSPVSPTAARPVPPGM